MNEKQPLEVRTMAVGDTVRVSRGLGLTRKSYEFIVVKEKPAYERGRRIGVKQISIQKDKDTSFMRFVANIPIVRDFFSSINNDIKFD